MRIGIIGLPGSGKSTVYRLLTRGQPSHHGSRTGEPSIAVVKIPDPRLERLASLFKPKKVTPASIEFIDLPPLIKGSGKVGSPSAQVLPQMRQGMASWQSFAHSQRTVSRISRGESIGLPTPPFSRTSFCWPIWTWWRNGLPRSRKDCEKGKRTKACRSLRS